MTIDVSLIPQNRVENLISKLSEIENNIGNIGTDITNNLVHKNGDETISGTKTFTSPIQRTASLGGGGNFLIKLTDSNGKGSVNQSSYYVNGVLYNRLNIINSSSGKEGYIEIQHNDDGEYRGVIGGNGTNLSLTRAVSSTTENEIPTKGWVNNPATSTNVVHRSGDESINGTKTFNDNMFTKNIFPKGYITLGTSTNTWGHMIQFQDTTGKRIARVQPMAIDTTKNRMGIWVNNADNTVEQGIEVWSDGTTYICGNLVKGFVKETWQSGANWYRVWSDGWIEQGGQYGSWSNNPHLTISLNKAFTQTNYAVSVFSFGTTQDTYTGQLSFVSRTTSNFVVNPHTNDRGGISWIAMGY